MRKRDEISCIYDQIIFEECLITFQVLMENENKLFKEYIEKI